MAILRRVQSVYRMSKLLGIMQMLLQANSIAKVLI
ncbi:MAG: hypothetical protein ACJAVV_001482 [Alphaproteobacteria bacterium]|jgi:hypothetical protein